MGNKSGHKAIYQLFSYPIIQPTAKLQTGLGGRENSPHKTKADTSPQSLAPAFVLCYTYLEINLPFAPFRICLFGLKGTAT